MKDQILLIKIGFEDNSWKAEYYGKPIKISRLEYKTNILKSNTLRETFRTRKEAISFCKQFDAVIEYFSKDFYTSTTLEPCGKVQRIKFTKHEYLEA